MPANIPRLLTSTAPRESLLSLAAVQYDFRHTVGCHLARSCDVPTRHVDTAEVAQHSYHLSEAPELSQSFCTFLYM